jgi:hypothetical protein
MRAGARRRTTRSSSAGTRRDEERGAAHETAGALVEGRRRLRFADRGFRGLRVRPRYAQAAARLRGSRAYKDARPRAGDRRRTAGPAHRRVGTAIQQLMGARGRPPGRASPSVARHVRQPPPRVRRSRTASEARRAPRASAAPGSRPWRPRLRLALRGKEYRRAAEPLAIAARSSRSAPASSTSWPVSTPWAGKERPACKRSSARGGGFRDVEALGASPILERIPAEPPPSRGDRWSARAPLPRFR